MAIELKASALELSLLAMLKARRPAHGYALVGVIRRLGGGRFEVAGCTLYPALHRLEAADLIKRKRVKVHGRERRQYAITPQGFAEWAERTADWRRWSETFDQLLNPRPLLMDGQWSGQRPAAAPATLVRK